MANKEKIDYLLLDIRELETLVAGMRDAEVYPVSFFGQTFDLTHKILKDLHALETAQIEMLRKQMEEHQALIQSIPPSVATPVQTVGSFDYSPGSDSGRTGASHPRAGNQTGASCRTRITGRTGANPR